MSAAAARVNDVRGALFSRFGEASFALQETRDETPTLWVDRERAREVLAWLARESERPFPMLYDLSAVDERDRTARDGRPPADFSLVYHLLAPERTEDVRLKVALEGEYPSQPSVTDLWPAAGWYEREVWDMFGVRFEGHPDLRRILMPRTWQGHPLRREHPARATEMGPFVLDAGRRDAEDEALEIRPEEWGLEPADGGDELMVLNVGPQHPGTHGVLRVALRLDGEGIVDAVPEIGFHHRGVEKMAERQTWHTFIPYTDRVDYLGGVMNNLPYLLAVEKLCGIEVPERAQVIRVMLAELFRVASHLVWYGTFAQDLGALSPVFYTFSDRERVFDAVQAICGGRMHPNWFRIGGVAQDLPRGWEGLVRPLLEELPRRLDEYDAMVMRNRTFQARTRGIGSYTADEALRWGVTGPGLRACGVRWDLRKARPYSGYERFDFDVPTGRDGDCYDRGVVRVEEMRQSLRIVGQCVDRMPSGPVKADHPLATPPPRERTMRDIETLITHFLAESWGPVVPAGEAGAVVEASKGLNGYHLISDGGTGPYRARIRTPSFPHLQMLPAISRGHAIPDLLAILGSIDYVLADVDR